MVVTGYKRELLIVKEQPDLMSEITKLDSDEGVAKIVWAMAVYDFNKQNVTMTEMDYSASAAHIQTLCELHSNTVGLEGYWHISAGFSSLGMSDLDTKNFRSPNTRVHVVIENPNRMDTLVLNFQVMGILINTI